MTSSPRHLAQQADAASRSGSISHSRVPLTEALLLLALIALNLRPFLTSVGPVLELLRADTGLGYRAASVLTALPFVLMGVLAFAGARLAGGIGERRTIAVALLLLAAGCAARWWVQGGSGLIASAGLAGAGVAAIQALMPGVAKRLLPQHVGLAMGVYSAALVGGGALGAMGSPWLAQQGGWRLALAAWLLPALLALLLWLHRAEQAPQQHNYWQGSLLPFARNRRAWLLALYFGFTNSGYSSLVAWLPSFYREAGLPTQTAANLLAVLAVLQALAALAFPLLSRRHGDHRYWLWLALACQAAGLAGLAWAPLAAPWCWVMLAGVGLGGFFSLCLLLVLEHLPDAGSAGRLAAFVQGCGFLLTAAGPWLMGWWKERGGQFSGGWQWQLGIVLAMLLLTARFSPASYPRAMRGL
ncbi:cyanate transporter [Vogesella sp. LIG4]|uniref:cyanate transporter n=1 Tax=Vogesella sp. LIG4 TaxID=1192162 RepID=UPI000B5AEFD0|nr:cyanate transporter [Vogesella sp. LIG4]